MNRSSGLAVEIPLETAEELYDHAPCGYLSTSPEGTILRVNQTLLTWTGHTRQRLLGAPFGDLLTVSGRVFHDTHYAPLLALQGFAREIALDLACANGFRLPVLLNAVRTTPQAGGTPVHRITLFDARERRQYERELLLARRRAEEAAQAKSEFLTTLSHELRTPLTAIVGISHLLEGQGAPELVRALQVSSGHLLALINDVLDLAKLEAGKLVLDPRTFDPRGWLEDVAAVLRPAAEDKGIGLVVDVDPGVPAAVRGDEGKLRQVLTNLVGNAVKFTAAGSVTVRARVLALDGDRVRLSVSVVDTGIGIPADRLGALFQDFAQAGPEVATHYGGTGLGLSISRRLLALMGSEIAVDSEVARGSTFTFALDLPVVAREEAADAAPDLLAEVKGMSVLVAEDNRVNTMVLGAFLGRWGIRFDCVGDGRAAVEKVREGQHDLVLMDLHMPELGGAEATRAIRRLPGDRFRRLPIVAISAGDPAGGEVPEEFTAVMGKPFHPDRLLALLAEQRRGSR